MGASRPPATIVLMGDADDSYDFLEIRASSKTAPRLRPRPGCRLPPAVHDHARRDAVLTPLVWQPGVLFLARLVVSRADQRHLLRHARVHEKVYDELDSAAPGWSSPPR